jgi:hypothetical protein
MSTETKPPITHIILVWKDRDSEIVGVQVDHGGYGNIREMFLRWLRIDAARLEKVQFIRRGWTGESDIVIETIYSCEFEQPRIDCEKDPTFQTAWMSVDARGL